MVEFITQLFTSCQELTKYYVIRNISTGDKTLDNLMSATIILLIGYVFQAKIWIDTFKKIMTYLPKLIPKRFKKLAKTNNILKMEPPSYYNNTEFTKIHYTEAETYISKYFDVKTYQRITWSNTDNKFFLALLHFIYREHAYIVEAKALKFDNDLSMVDTGMKLDMRHIYYSRGTTAPIYLPIFFHNNELIAYHCAYEGRYHYLYYKSENTLRKFRDFVLTYSPAVQEKKEVVSIMVPMIYRIDYNNMDFIETTTKIYPDRNFDNYISRYKSQIISMLDNFKQMQTAGKARFNNYGTYNLGFMVHGKPGCGKTLLTKALANYLKRDLVIVDMRKIKTRTMFEKLFSSTGEVTTNIYIFDEFDCVQGILSREHPTEDKSNNDNNTKTDNEAKEERTNNEIAVLKKQRLDFLMMLHKTSEEKAKEEIKKHIEEIDKKVYHLEDQLTLDTMLTVLDGVEEVRGRVIVANTNYIDRIDPALLREGRFDIKLHLTEFNDDETKELLCQMFNDEESKKIINSYQYVEGKFSPTAIMNLCFQHNDLLKVIHILKV